MKQSSMTFAELTDTLPFIKVVWNGKVVYDDGDRDVFDEFYNKYAHREVYEMFMKVVECHHLAIWVKGE